MGNVTDQVLMITPELCIGCRACQVACKEWNNAEADETKNTGTYENPSDLTGELYNRIKFIESNSEQGVKWLFGSQRCMHCKDAGCVKACPQHAVFQTDQGVVMFDKSLCLGRFAKEDKLECAQACPFKIVRFDKAGKISKCTFCHDRVINGLQPACAKTCPTMAIQYGNRDQLIKERRDSGYSTIYGEKELGGLKVLFSLKESPSVYGLPENPSIPAVVSMLELVDMLLPKWLT
jgi:formate dehydrogenase iron-sulfur subunit